MKKLTLAEWYSGTDQYNNAEESFEFLTGLLEGGNKIHLGDCTNDSCPCDLCVLETILVEYREYYVNKENKNE